MDFEDSDPRSTAQEFLRSDIFTDTLTRAIQQNLAPYGNKIAALREELTPVREKITALETTVRQILEEKEMSGSAGVTPAVSLTPAAAATPAASVAAATPVVPQPTRQQLPHPEPFDGKDRALFSPWKTSILAKLSIEGDVTGDHRAQFFYIHNRLKGKALQMVTAYIEGAQKKIPLTLMTSSPTRPLHTMTPTRKRKPPTSLMLCAKARMSHFPASCPCLRSCSLKPEDLPGLTKTKSTPLNSPFTLTYGMLLQP